MSQTLQCMVGKLTWPTPVALASGTCGYAAELDGLLDWRSIGAVFTKGISLKPQQGHPPPRLYQPHSGQLLNAIGLENVGLDAFLKEKLPFLLQLKTQYGIAIYVNLFGRNVDEYASVAAHLHHEAAIDGVEINLSCPNVKAGGLEFGRDAASCRLVTEAVRGVFARSVVVKLSPIGDVVNLAYAAQQGGADVLCMGNSVPALSFNIETKQPNLAAGYGGLSGPSIRSLVLRQVDSLARYIDLPIIATGGIEHGRDAVAYLWAGASAVSVGTATFKNPATANAVSQFIADYVQTHPLPHFSKMAQAAR